MLLKRPSLRDIARTAMDRAQGVVTLLRASSPPAQRVIHKFRGAGAVSPRTAQRFRASSRADEDAFAYLLSIRIIRQSEPNQYYLDEQSLLRFLNRSL